MTSTLNKKKGIFKEICREESSWVNIYFEKKSVSVTEIVQEPMSKD